MSDTVGSDMAGKLPVRGTPRRGRPSVEQSAELTCDLIACATHLFLSQGFDGTTMEGVALLAGVPKTTLYKRFGDKVALLRAVIEARVESWSDIASSRNDSLTDDLGQRLKFYTAAVLTWGTTAEVKAFGRLASSIPADDAGQRTHLGLFGTKRMIGLIAGDIRDFGLSCGVCADDPQRVATALMALIKGWMDFRDNAAPISEADAVSQADYLVDLLTLGRNVW